MFAIRVESEYRLRETTYRAEERWKTRVRFRSVQDPDACFEQFFLIVTRTIYVTGVGACSSLRTTSTFTTRKEKKGKRGKERGGKKRRRKEERKRRENEITLTCRWSAPRDRLVERLRIFRSFEPLKYSESMMSLLRDPGVGAPRPRGTF